MEKRYRSFDFELRAGDETGPTTIQGYACVFDSPSVDLGGYTEVVKPGAFTEALKASDLDVIANREHDNNRMLARFCPSIGADTLSLNEDDHGLFVSFAIPETEEGRTLVWDINHKNLTQMSFCFAPVEEQTDQAGKTREIVACSLHDVAFVLFPAYPATEVELRAVPVANMIQVKRKQIEVRSKIFTVGA